VSLSTEILEQIKANEDALLNSPYGVDCFFAGGFKSEWYEKQHRSSLQFKQEKDKEDNGVVLLLFLSYQGYLKP
jgi:hypothetical protein